MRRFLSLAFLTSVALILGMLPASALTTTPDATPWMANGTVLASVQYGNVLFVGGSFQRIGESVSPGPNAGAFVSGYTGLAAIDMATGQAISNFQPQLTANANQDLVVMALAVVGDRLFVGGQFSTVDGESHYNLAAIDINPTTIRGTVVSSFDPVVGIPGNANEHNFDVKTILSGADGIYIGGGFSKVDGKGRPKTAKLDWNGNLVDAYKTAGVNGSVNDMVWSADQQSIFLAGHFTQLGVGNPRVAIGRIDPTTGATLPWSVPVSQMPGATSSGQICYELNVTVDSCLRGLRQDPQLRRSLPRRQRERGHAHVAVEHRRQRPDARPDPGHGRPRDRRAPRHQQQQQHVRLQRPHAVRPELRAGHLDPRDRDHPQRGDDDELRLAAHGREHIGHRSVGRL